MGGLYDVVTLNVFLTEVAVGQGHAHMEVCHSPILETYRHLRRIFPPARTLLASSLKASPQHSVSGGLLREALISPNIQIELQFPKNICSTGADTWWLGSDAEV